MGIISFFFYVCKCSTGLGHHHELWDAWHPEFGMHVKLNFGMRVFFLCNSMTDLGCQREVWEACTLSSAIPRLIYVITLNLEMHGTLNFGVQPWVFPLRFHDWIRSWQRSMGIMLIFFCNCTTSFGHIPEFWDACTQFWDKLRGVFRRQFHDCVSHHSEVRDPGVFSSAIALLL